MDAGEEGVKVGRRRGALGSGRRRLSVGDRSREEVGCQIRSRRRPRTGSTREEADCRTDKGGAVGRRSGTGDIGGAVGSRPPLLKRRGWASGRSRTKVEPLGEGFLQGPINEGLMGGFDGLLLLGA